MIKYRFIFSLTLFFWLAISLAQNPNGYYNTASGKQESELKTSLHNIIKAQTTITYSSVWSAFVQTDQRSNGTYWDMFSHHMRSIESTYGLNREHSFPVSWWDGTRNQNLPPYTDLNHIFPSDAAANTAKSNYPLGVVGQNPIFDNGMTKVGNNSFPGYTGRVFEPDNQYKGDFARAYFYMVTRYQDYYIQWRYTYMVSSNTYPTLQPWAIELLLKWHREDPVSAKEISRNEAVFTIQNNRNPFIDYPNLVEHIWGNKKNEAFVINTDILQPVLVTPTNNTRLNFGTVVASDPKTLILYVKGINLAGNISIRLNDQTGLFSIVNLTETSTNRFSLPTALTYGEGFPLQVKFAPNQTNQDYSASITVFNFDNSYGSVLVNISASAITANKLTPSTALDATSIKASEFTANWQQVVGTDSYIINVYSTENNELIKSIDAENNVGSYLISELDGGKEYKYTIQREVKGLLTEHSNAIIVRTTTSITNNKNKSQLDIWTINNTINIENKSHIPKNITIYNFLGIVVFETNNFTGTASYTPSVSGLYFIKSGEFVDVVQVAGR